MLQSVLRGQPFVWITMHQTFREVTSCLREMIPLRGMAKMPFNDPFLHLCTVAWEGHATSQEDESYDSKTPHVTFRSVMACQYVRGNVGQSAASCFHPGALLAKLAEAKINQLQKVSSFGGVHEIVKLQISVR